MLIELLIDKLILLYHWSTINYAHFTLKMYFFISNVFFSEYKYNLFVHN